jgi:glycosyltransferase involved in cell wall biosynthesis
VKVLELMAAGVPTVAYGVGELPATLGDGGIVVAPGDAEAFAAALVELLGDSERAARMGAAAQARVGERFTWDGLAEIACAAYTLALDGRRSGA